MVAEQLVVFILQRIAFGFGTALLWCQSLAYARFALAPPGRQQRRVQPLPAEQRSNRFAGTLFLLSAASTSRLL